MDNEVSLHSYRHEITYAGDARLGVGEHKEVYGPTEKGGIAQQDEAVSPLSSIIAQVNQHCDITLTEEDRVFLEQVGDEMLQDNQLQALARANPMEQIRTVFEKRNVEAIFSKMTQNQKFVLSFIDKENAKLREIIQNAMLNDFYKRANSPSAVKSRR